MPAVSRLSNYRVCVVGGGLAGLSAAYDLGRAGAEVIVLERAREIGGRHGESAVRSVGRSRAHSRNSGINPAVCLQSCQWKTRALII